MGLKKNHHDNIWIIRRHKLIKTTKSDIIWNYVGSIFNLGMSVFILPFILRKLSTHELGLWYVFGSIAALVSLLDFGFSPSIMRNIIYAWSGAKTLFKEGVPTTFEENKPNYSLLRTLLSASRIVYLIISVIAAILLFLLGTPYISGLIENSPNTYLIAWGIYSFGVFLNLYYSYWSPLLKGVGAIKEANQVQVFTRILYMIFTVVGLQNGGGLIWLSLMYLISGLLLNILSKKYFVKITNISDFKSDNFELYSMKEILIIIWPNAKKQGLVTIGGWLITRSTTLLSSHFYGLTITAQLGLTLQLYGFIGGLSSLLFNSYIPEIASSSLRGDKTRFKNLFSRSIVIQWIMGVFGIISVVFIAPLFLKVIDSNSTLLPMNELIILGLILLLEWNHSTFANLITLSNKVPFLTSSLFSGIGIVLLSFMVAKFTNLGVMGLIFSQGFVQILYNNWYWPRYVFKENNLTILMVIRQGINDIFKLIINYLKKYKLRRDQL